MTAPGDATRAEMEASVSMQVTTDGDSYVVRGALPIHIAAVVSLSATPEELETAKKLVREALVNAGLRMSLWMAT